MKRPPTEQGYILADVIVGLILFGLVLLSVYQLYLPTLTLSRDMSARLAVQQDVRLAIDRVARAMHETTASFGRLRVYPSESGCTDAYEGCIGFVSARDANCSGSFQLVDGAPSWQATMYLWRDTASNELRLRCDPSTAFPVVRWPPRLVPYTVIGINVVSASFTLRPVETSNPTSIAMALEEQAPTSSRLTSKHQTHFFNQTVFLPQNP